MKTRVHIHREKLTGAKNLLHFIVMLPFDVEQVIGIKVSIQGMKKSDEDGHFEAGTFRISRDGFLLYEIQVLDETNEPEFVNGATGFFLDGGIKAQSGTKQIFDAVSFSGEPRALFCKYDANKAPSSSAYTLVLYFIYNKKPKK